MAPIAKQDPSMVQMPAMSAADKYKAYKAYVRSNTNPNHQFDDNMEESNRNTLDQMPSMSAADIYNAYVQSNTNPIHQFDDNMKEPNKNTHDQLPPPKSFACNNKAYIQKNVNSCEQVEENIKKPNINTPDPMPAMSATDKYKAYVQSNTKPIRQLDDNMKEANNNSPGFKNTNIKNSGDKISDNNSSNDDTQYYFTCFTSYSCTPIDVSSVETNHKIKESPENDDQVCQEKQLDPNNNQLENDENSKYGQNGKFDDIKNTQIKCQVRQIKPMESSEISQIEEINTLKNTLCGKPAPHAELINVKNTPRIPSPLIMLNDDTHKQPLRQRTISGSAVSDKPNGPYGLAHSHSSPSLSSKGSSPSANESLVLHYFQNPHTYKNLQEHQLPGQGPVPKSMLPPPAPPVVKRKANSRSPHNSFNEKRNSLPNAKSTDSKSNAWEEVLTKFYEW